MITFPGEVGVTVFFVCCTAVKHRKAARHSPTTASQHRNDNEGTWHRSQGARSNTLMPQLFVDADAGVEDLSFRGRWGWHAQRTVPSPT